VFLGACGEDGEMVKNHCFSPIIERNSIETIIDLKHWRLIL
jgi:hypothetical protein